MNKWIWVNGRFFLRRWKPEPDITCQTKNHIPVPMTNEWSHISNHITYHSSIRAF